MFLRPGLSPLAALWPADSPSESLGVLPCLPRLTTAAPRPAAEEEAGHMGHWYPFELVQCLYCHWISFPQFCVQHVILLIHEQQ